MDGFLEFALERYNYWIVIVLMMTGLYIVFARGNLVKKLVGLNLFQTSVFIFYLTIGKIAGGTAPIYVGGELDHGGGHGEDAGGHEGLNEAAHDVGAAVSEHGIDTAHAPEVAADLHSKIDNSTLAANDLKSAVNSLGSAGTSGEAESLHAAPAEAPSKIANDALASIKPETGFEIAEKAGDHGDATVSHGADAAHAVGEIIYTNPLPHVLILTAIVVGVATTAVGLALAVRIREAYGTIEEDELEAIDDVAEFGAEAGAAS